MAKKKLDMKEQLVWSSYGATDHALIPTPFVWEGDPYQILSLLNTMKLAGPNLQSCRLAGSSKNLHIIHFRHQVNQLAIIRDMFSDT